MARPYKLSKKRDNSIDFATERNELTSTYLKNRKDIEALSALLEKIRQESGRSYEELLRIAAEKDSIVNIKDLIEIIKDKESFTHIPVSIFNSSLAPLEAVVLYLKDNQKMKLCRIAKSLSRDDRTIWLTYGNARKKKEPAKKGPAISPGTGPDILVPLSIFSNRRFSILESLAAYLKDIKGMHFKDIAENLGKSQKTIYTVYARQRKKLGRVRPR